MSLTKKDIEFWISGIPGDYFIKKIATGKYRVSADRARTLRLMHDALGARYKTTSAPSVTNMWFTVESKTASNPAKTIEKRFYSTGHLLNEEARTYSYRGRSASGRFPQILSVTRDGNGFKFFVGAKEVKVPKPVHMEIIRHYKLGPVDSTVLKAYNPRRARRNGSTKYRLKSARSIAKRMKIYGGKRLAKLGSKIVRKNRRNCGCKRK